MKIRSDLVPFALSESVALGASCLDPCKARAQRQDRGAKAIDRTLNRLAPFFSSPTIDVSYEGLGVQLLQM